MSDQVVVRIDSGHKACLKLLAEKLKTGQSDMVREAISEFIGRRMPLLQNAAQ